MSLHVKLFCAGSFAWVVLVNCQLGSDEAGLGLGVNCGLEATSGPPEHVG